MDIKEVRLARLQELLDEHDGLKVELAKTLKKKPAQISQWCNHVRSISEESARQIERHAKRPRNWMDTPPIRVTTTGPALVSYAEAQPLPLALPWPFPRIDQRRISRLEPGHIRDIEAAMLLTAAQLGVTIHKRRAA